MVTSEVPEATAGWRAKVGVPAGDLLGHRLGDIEALLSAGGRVGALRALRVLAAATGTTAAAWVGRAAVLALATLVIATALGVTASCCAPPLE